MSGPACDGLPVIWLSGPWLSVCPRLPVHDGGQMGYERPPPVGECGTQPDVFARVPAVELQGYGVSQCGAVNGDDLDAGSGQR
jgi:hypothetical protein